MNIIEWNKVVEHADKRLETWLENRSSEVYHYGPILSIEEKFTQTTKVQIPYLCVDFKTQRGTSMYSVTIIGMADTYDHAIGSIDYFFDVRIKSELMRKQ